MMLKLEDDIYATNPCHEYINSDKIFRVRLTKKRIRIYKAPTIFNHIYVGRTKHNMEELKKIGIEE